MITIGQILPLIRNADMITVGFNGGAIEISADNQLDVAAYGRFALEYIHVSGEKANIVELGILQKPVIIEEGN